MPHVEFDPSRRRFMLAAAGLLTAGASAVDMFAPFDDPQKKSFPPLTTTNEDFSKMLEVRNNCRGAVVDPNSQTCLKAEQDIGRELEAQVALRGKLRQEQLRRDNILLLVGATIGLIGLRTSR